MNEASKSTKKIANDLSGLVDSKKFSNLDPDIQKNLIEKVTTFKQIESGKMAYFLGTKMPNMSIYSAFIICCILLLLTGIDLFISKICCKNLDLELIKIIIPVITMSLGYMFGNSNHKDKKEDKD